MASSVFFRRIAFPLFALLGLTLRGSEMGPPQTALAPTPLVAAASASVKSVPLRENQVLFIESNVPDYRALLSELPKGAHYLVFNAKADGLHQIADYLQRHPGVDAIHLVSHGDKGQVQLGKTLLESADLDRYKKDLARIGSSMKPGGDFLIYDCDVAGGENGKALVQQIAALTKLNVAASTGPTGAASLGGDWTLEYRIGDIHTPTIFSSAVEQRYQYLLGQTVETYDADVGFDTPGGESGTTSFTLDGITYTTDQAVESVVDSFSDNQFGPPPLTSSSAPNNGVLFMNLDETPLSSVTISLSNGQGMTLQSFDLDVIAGTQIWIEPNGNPSNKVVKVTDGDGVETTFLHIDLSSNANFAGITSFTIVDVGDSSGVFLPTIDNLTYTPGSPPVVTTSSGTTSYVGGASAAVVDSGITVSDSDSTTQASGTVSIGSGFHIGDTLAFTNTSATLYGNISVSSYNSTTGVLTLTSSGATATDAQWANALDAVTFSAGSNAISGNRTISFVVNDGTQNSAAATQTVRVSAPPIVTTDSGSASFVAADNTASTPVTIDSGLTVTDGSSLTLQSATVTITGSFHSGEDVLGFTNNGSTMGNIGASYNASTGVLSLSSAGSTATIAQWQAALDAVKYTDTAVTPNSATRTISFTVNDGSNVSNTGTRNVTVSDTDQSPILSGTNGTTGYVGGSSATTIDSDVTVSDLDNTTMSSATVSIGTGFHIGDTLAFTNTSGALYGNISVSSYNSTTGVLTLTSSGATATDAQWANALDAVTFSASSGTTPGNRIISFVINDGTENAVAITQTVAVSAPPIVTTDSGSASFIAADNTASTPVNIDSGLTVTDGSSLTLQSATVAITGNFHSGEDVLGFTNNGSTMGNIGASYNASTGVLLLSSAGNTATIAQWQAALEAVKYTDTAVTPNSATRTISFTVNDGSNVSNTGTRNVTVSDTDQTPILSGTNGTTGYVGGGSSATIDSGVTVSDLDNTTLASATVSIGSGFHSGDTLAFTNTTGTLYGNISAAYNSGTGVLTLTSSGATATDAQWAHTLDAVTFSASSGTTPGNRIISFVINDGTENAVAITQTVAVSAPPIVTTDSGSAAFVAADNGPSTPVTIDSGLILTDASSATLQSAIVAITGNYHSSEDVLGFTNNAGTMGNITGSYNSTTGVLTLTSSGGTSLAHWQAALEAVTYIPNVTTPNPATRTISFTVNDGSNISNTATRNVTVSDTDQTPILSGTNGTTGYVGGGSSATIDSGVTVSDLDNTTLASATVSIGSGFHNGDTLAFTNTSGTLYGNISVASYNSATGVLTLTSSGATATDGQWANALDAVTFSASSSATPGNRTISFVINDGTENAVAITQTVDVSDPPIVTTDSGSAAFVAADNTASTSVVVDSGLIVTDGSSSTLQSATVAITGNYHSGEDVLGFTNNPATMGDVTGSYNSTTGVLTLSSSGGASLAHWQAALGAVVYIANVITPNNATRTISFTVNDGSNVSNTATRTVTVTDTDQTPVVTTAGTTTAFVQNGGAVVIDGSVTVSDRDNTALVSATVSISGNFHSGEDVLSFTNDGSTMGDIGGSYNATTGILTLTSSTATLAEWQKALAAVTYRDTATTPNTATRTITLTVNDGTVNSAGTTQSVSVSLQVTPTITWSTPSAIIYGTALSGAQLNATATVSGTTVAGTFSYTPAGGTILSAGPNQTLGVTFTPTDTLHYTTAGASTSISVNQATPMIAWNAPSDIVYGTALSSTQLNATASFSGSPIAGTLVYTPASGTVLPGGVQSLGVVFTPTDATDFAGATGSVNLNVNRAGQTVSFPTVSSVKVGVPVTLNATASSGLTPTFSLVSGNANLSGSTLVINDVNPVVVRASQSGDSNYIGDSLDQTITAKRIQTITFPSISQHKVTDLPFSVSATASSGLTVTYSILSGPASVSGDMITLTGTTGTVMVQADQAGDATYVAADPVTVSFTVISTNSWVFFGSLQDPNNSSNRLPNGQRKALALTPQSITQPEFAATLSSDGTSGVLVGSISSLNQGFLFKFSPDQNGHFTGTTTTLGGEGSPVTLTISGTATSSAINGTIQPLGLTFQSTPDSLVGPTADVSGFYTGSTLNNASGSTYLVVGSQGDIYSLALSPSGVTAGEGTIDASDHTFAIQATSTSSITGAIDVSKGTAEGAITSGEETTRFSDVSSVVAVSDVLVNMSNRGIVTPNSPLILGFVVAGTTDKTVVVRGIGPSLSAFGIGNPLTRPQLTLYNASGAVLGSNSGWGGTTILSSAFSQVGAFALSSTSADAALKITLPPGAYTAVISDGANDQGGTALAEIYDASIDPSEVTQRLVNGSARGFVATGGPLIQGFVVTGNAPKKVLIRAVGPGLTSYGLTSPLTDPIVTVYDVSGNVVAWNDDWGTPLTVTNSQSVANAAELTAAASNVGAFALASGSKDSAVIVNLAPGAYTAVVSSPDGTTGTVLIEVYEL